MKILINESMIRRYAKIGTYTTIAAFIILAAGMYVSFAYQNLLNLSFAALVLGFLLSQVGIFFQNRWGRKPRMDESLSSSMKGLTKEYTLYHFLTPVSHLLVGPAGIWNIEPYYQRGTIVYEKGKWKQKGGGFLLAYLKVFAQEGLGRPDAEASSDTDNLNKFFQKNLEEGQEMPPVNTILVFTDPRAEIIPGDSPIPAVKIDKLKEFLRQRAKQAPLAPAEVQRVTAMLPLESKV